MLMELFPPSQVHWSPPPLKDVMCPVFVFDWLKIRSSTGTCILAVTGSMVIFTVISVRWVTQVSPHPFVCLCVHPSLLVESSYLPFVLPFFLSHVLSPPLANMKHLTLTRTVTSLSGRRSQFNPYRAAFLTLRPCVRVAFPRLC